MTGVKLGCAANDATCPHIQGSLPAALGNLSELFVLDIQVSLQIFKALVPLLKMAEGLVTRSLCVRV